MQLSELKERLKNHDFESIEQRAILISNILKHCTKLTMGEIQSFQRNWNARVGTFEEFCNKLDHILLECIELEQIDTGQVAREVYGFPELLDTLEISDTVKN